MSGLLSYRTGRFAGSPSPRTERTTEKTAVTPSAGSAQTQKKNPLDFPA